MSSPRSSKLLPCFALALLSPLAAADTITGRVVDSQGQGVPGVDIDAEDLINGGDPGLMNGGTDSNGFFTATLPSGFYRITFTPPPPPTTTHLMAEVDNLSVVGVVDLGVITLPAGVSLGGRILNPSGFPVQNIDIDVIERSTGDDLDLPGDSTNAFGNFLLAVPPVPLDVQFETRNVAGQTLVPIELQLSPTADLDLGDLTLEAGFVVSGTIRNSSNAPVQGVDIDAVNSITGEKAFTPGDNSDALGNFSVIVPGGTWDFDACPPAATMLVAASQPDVPISSDTNVGVVTLQNGVLLFGTIRDASGRPIRHADVDVVRSSNGARIALCGDNTDAQGNYAVRIPTGTFDVIFSRPRYPFSGMDLHPAVLVSGDTRVDGVLEDCPCALLPYAGPISAAGIVQRSRAAGGKLHPRLQAAGGSLVLSGDVPGGTAILLFGPENDPFAVTTSRQALRLDSLGQLTVHLPGLPLETALFVRFALLDPSAPADFTLSSGVRISANF